MLVKKTWTGGASHSFSYGFTASWYLSNACLLLLAGVTLTANKHHTSTFEASPFWGSSGESVGGCLPGSGLERRTSCREASTKWLRLRPLLPYLLCPATHAYVASYVLAFIAAGLQLVQAAAMISNRRSFGRNAQSEPR